MSKYTTQVRWIVEFYTPGSTLPLSKRINAALPKIFDFDFPIWEESYRPTLERKIILHYINKEIGLETMQLWKLYLEERLNLIMPYYVQVYETISRDYDWLTDTKFQETYDYARNRDLNEDFKGNLIGNIINKATSSSDETAHTTGKNLNSDLPQANYAGLDYGTNLLDSNEDFSREYSDKADNNTDTTNTTTNNLVDKENIKDNYTKNKTGANGNRSFTELMLQRRESLINIDKMIIDDLIDLFMLVY